MKMIRDVLRSFKKKLLKAEGLFILVFLGDDMAEMKEQNTANQR